MFSEIPLIKKLVSEKNCEYFRPYLQIFKESKLIHNTLNLGSVQEFQQSDMSFWFDLGIEVSNDILIRIKHFENNDTRYPVFRLMVNTAFMFDNILRFYKV